MQPAKTNLYSLRNQARQLFSMLLLLAPDTSYVAHRNLRLLSYTSRCLQIARPAALT